MKVRYRQLFTIPHSGVFSPQLQRKEQKPPGKPAAFAFPSCNHSYAPQRHGAREEFLVTVKADMIDPHFAGFDTIHYLLKVFVFDLQSITD
jgi:hypothetical protein